MLRILFFLLVVFGLGIGFAWLADRPGDMVVTFDGYQYQVSLMVAAVAVTAVVAAVMIAWWLVKSIWNSPYAIARYFRVRRRDRGYQALSTGMVAAGAGDGALARKMNKQAAKLIRSETEPLIGLLDAQASLLEGDHAAAREKFERMLDDPEMRLLGLRGLYLEAERLGDRAAARHYANRAADLAPQLGWAAESTLEDKVAQGDFDGALRLADAQKASHRTDREASARRRAVLLTAKAQDLLETDPAAARAAALEANKLRPDFVPAAAIAARVLFRQNDVRKGAKILEAAWKAEPHPELADLYVHARPGDAVLDRLERARKLKGQHPNHVEAELAVARAALDARDFAAAREAAEAAMRIEPREGGYLLLADIEEADGGSQGRIRQHLAKAVRAPRDPAWVADGYVSERWMPLSPVTGKVDAFEWRAPVERIGRMIEQDEPVEQSPPPALVPPEPVADHDVVDVPAEPAGDRAAAPAAAATPQDARPPEPAAPPLPDDPGVDPSDVDAPGRRFRLF